MRRQISRLAILCTLGIAGLSGCNSARYVTVNNQNGVVAIPDNSNSWPNYNRKHAEELMQAKCPNGYVIDREEEVVVGQTRTTDTTTQKQRDPLLPFVDRVTEDTQQRTSVQDQTEWRIYYHRADTPVVQTSGRVMPQGPQSGPTLPVVGGPPSGPPVPISR